MISTRALHGNIARDRVAAPISCVYDPFAMQALAKRVGAERIVLGSDYPFGEDKDILGFVAGATGFDDADLARIAHGNAAVLLGITV